MNYVLKYRIKYGDKSLKLKTRFILCLMIVLITGTLIYVFKPFSILKSSLEEKSKLISSKNNMALLQKSTAQTEVTASSSKITTPLNGVVTQGYGGSHTGVDIQGKHHDNIISIDKGIITFAGVQNGYGNCIEIKHSKNGSTYYSFYAHLSKILVKYGDTVTAGQVIAKEGGAPGVDPNPGNSTGHHLHFEIRTKSGYRNDVNPFNNKWFKLSL